MRQGSAVESPIRDSDWLLRFCANLAPLGGWCTINEPLPHLVLARIGFQPMGAGLVSKFVHAYLGARGTLPLLRREEAKAGRVHGNGPKAMRSDNRAETGELLVLRS